MKKGILSMAALIIMSAAGTMLTTSCADDSSATPTKTIVKAPISKYVSADVHSGIYLSKGILECYDVYAEYEEGGKTIKVGAETTPTEFKIDNSTYTLYFLGYSNSNAPTDIKKKTTVHFKFKEGTKLPEKLDCNVIYGSEMCNYKKSNGTQKDYELSSATSRILAGLQDVEQIKQLLQRFDGYEFHLNLWQ